MKENKANKQHIADLQKKIDGFSNNQGEVSIQILVLISDIAR